MDKPKLVCNLVPIYVGDVQVPVFYVPSEHTGCVRGKKKYDDEFPGLNKDEDVWWSFYEISDASKFDITVDNKRLFSFYLQDQLSRYFNDSGFIHSNNFAGGISIWIPCDESDVSGFTAHEKYSIRIQHDKNQYLGSKDLWCLQLTYEGIALVSSKPATQLRINAGSISKVILSNKICKAENLSESEIAQSCVVLNRFVRNDLRIPWKPYKVKNKYLEYYNRIDNFYRNYIKKIEINGLFHVQDSGFLSIRDKQIKLLNDPSSLLEFKNGNTHFNNYQGLKKFGPFKGPASNNVKFIFIFHDEDKNYANTLYQYLKKGYKGFPGLESFVEVPVNLDTQHSVRIPSGVNEVDYVKNKIADMALSDNEQYFAFYITQIKKDEATDEEQSIYYHIKTNLVDKGINSQVIYRDNISNPSFNFFLPNIAIAVLAKLNGIPWKLSRSIEKDLIIGMGAYRPDSSQLFLGTTIAFLNDGSFNEFSAIESNSIEDLTDFFKSSISKSLEINADIKRVVIHFYKDMSRDEADALASAINQLKLNIPYVVLHITEGASNSYMVFDEAYSAKMPVSGIAVEIRRNLYLLTNNQRYKTDAGMKIDDFPLPLKVNISKSSDAVLDEVEVKKLLDQIIQFSKMYWVGIKQKSLPVTILYSKRLAKFKGSCPELGLPTSVESHRTMWFL